MKTTSMKDFVPDPERENEALWGDKEGYAGFLKRQKATLNEKK